MTRANDLHEKWMKNEEYRKAHEDLAPEFSLARSVINARVTAKPISGSVEEEEAANHDH